MRGEEARQQAPAEELTLLVADNKAGYFGVHHKPGYTKPYRAQVWRGGKSVYLGSFATAPHQRSPTRRDTITCGRAS